MAIPTSGLSENGGRAPSYPVPNDRVISIEHPCIVQGLDDGLKSLGGEHQLKNTLEAKKKDTNNGTGHGLPVTVSLRPDDCFSQRLSSAVTPTQNVLIKVSLPKKTGRKRKRGSNNPFEDEDGPSHHAHITSLELLQRMRDNSDNYTIEPVGIVEDTHRFTHLPDYQIRASETPIMGEIRKHAMLPRYESLRDFHVDLDHESEGHTTFSGPPAFATDSGPLMWADRPEHTTAKPKTIRQRKSRAPATDARNEAFMMDSDLVPQIPSPSLPVPRPIVGRAIASMKKLMEQRPIVTIRAAHALLKTHTLKAIAQAIPHVGYFVGKGPWKDAIIKYGLDPRDDPRYRKYQTLIFRAYASREVNAVLQEKGKPADTHTFDGSGLFETAAIWQLCDLTDPVLAEIVNTPDIRTDCDQERHGWFFNATAAKIRIIMREKMRRIVNSEPMPPDDYYRVLNLLPNHIAEKEKCELDPSYPVDLQQLAKDIVSAAGRGEPHPYKILKSTFNRTEPDSGTDDPESGPEDELHDQVRSDQEDIEHGRHVLAAYPDITRDDADFEPSE